MKTTKRQRAPKIAALNFRVYQIPKGLKERVSTARADKEQTVEAFVNGAVDTHIGSLVEELLKSLGEKSSDATTPARLPLHDVTLKMLSVASKRTGIAASHLFLACLGRAAEAHSGRRRRG